MVFSSSYFASSCLLSLLFLLQPLLISSSSSSSPIPIAVPLSVSVSHTNSDADLYEKLSNLATTSVARAHHIKSSATTRTPLLPHSYGGYSISLGFGTPPQAMSLVMDTGSDFVWFPCTKRYACRNCSFPGSQQGIINSFTPKQSSSVRIVGCLNQKCGWVHRDIDASTSCRECPSLKNNCSQICPPYLITYGSGSTGGIGLIETLDLPPPHKKVGNFLVGCSLFSSRMPAGIAGFGRGPASLPSQLGLKRFSYCLLSRRFDDTGESTSLVLDDGAHSKKKTADFSYTPFVKNPHQDQKRALGVYYYVGLRRISVGGKKVKIPYKHLVADSEGNGGTIVDSGTTFTFMDAAVFEPVLAAFTRKVKRLYERASGIESLTGLSPCYNASRRGAAPELPELKLRFRGGAEMKLPLANYFARVGADDDVVCLTMVSDDINSGPSIILGSFQMQNYNVEFDLQNDLFGFKQQTCK